MILATLSKVGMTYYNNKNSSSSEIAIFIALRISNRYPLPLVFMECFKPSR